MRSDMIYTRHLKHSLLGGLFLLGLAQICEAQDTSRSNAAALSLRDNFSRLVNMIRSDALDAMPDLERRTLREINIRIPMDYNITRVEAFRDESGQRIIEMSFGFLGFIIMQLTEDFYFASESGDCLGCPNDIDKFDAYVDYLNEMVNRNERMLRKDHIKRFREYAEIPAEKWEAIVRRDDYALNVAKLQYSALGFILAHEIGHHVFGHVDRPPRSPAESRRYEAQADRYAVALTVKMDMSALGALPALVFFANHEGEVVNSDATHPLALCRVLEAFTATFDQIGYEYDRAKVRALYNQRCK
jgi:hypothetical protein